MSVFADVQKQLAKRALHAVARDAQGNEIAVDVRDDPEQKEKYDAIISLFLAAGYHRVRITTLTKFDKVVGGLAWSVTASNVPVEVDFLFQDDFSIGEKIALVEKIVYVLPYMGCPHRLEPHQIQGLDCVSIYPVVQWLVKKVVETREELGDSVRAFAEAQFAKSHLHPHDVEAQQKLPSVLATLERTSDRYKPRRLYRQPATQAARGVGERVQAVLLEYGHRYRLGRHVEGEVGADAKTARQAAAQQKKAQEAQDLAVKLEQETVDRLLRNMLESTDDDQTLSEAVTNLVGQHSTAIKEIVTELAERDDDEAAVLAANPALFRHRLLARLEKQIAAATEQLQGAQQEHVSMEGRVRDLQGQLQAARAHSNRLVHESKKLAANLSGQDEETLEHIRQLIGRQRQLQQQETEFKATCRAEAQALRRKIEEAHSRLEDNSESQRLEQIKRQHALEKQRHDARRLALAERNREVAGSQRKLDSIPTRTEVNQYQRRFLELYMQMEAKHIETKHIYELYNTCDDTRIYRQREVGLVSSVLETFRQALASEGAMRQFMAQLENVARGVAASLEKVRSREAEARADRDRAHATYLELVERERMYFRLVKDLQMEYTKNEVLSAEAERHKRQQ